MRHTVEVAQLEYDEGGHTLWVHDARGNTVLRLKCTGRIKIHRGCTNNVTHADFLIQGDMEICKPTKSRKKHVDSTSR